MRRLGLLGLLVVVALAAVTMGAGRSLAAPETTTPTTPTTPSTPTAPTPGLGSDLLDDILDQLAAGMGSSEGLLPGAGAGAPTSQMVVVTAPRASDQTATLTAFERGSDNSWKPVIGPTQAYLGSLGMGEPKDNVYRSPQGTFPLDQAFGRLANPGTKMPYFKTDQNDWWDSDMSSPTYNTHVRQAQSPGGDSENLYNMGPVYDYAVNIAHNPQRTPGKASAMFLHVTNNQPTMGCVAIERDLMKQVLVWLDPAKNPKITIGVNEGAPTGAAPGTGAPESTPGTPESQMPESQMPQSEMPQSTTPTPGAPSTPSPQTEMPGGDMLTELLTQLVNLVPILLGDGVGGGLDGAVPTA